MCAGKSVVTNSQHMTSPDANTASMTFEERESMALRLDIEAGDLACLVVEKNMYKSEVRSAVLARLQPRTMTNLSQSTMAQLTCFPYKAAHDLFPSNLRGSPNEMENILLWEADSVKQSQQLFSDLLESSKSTGLTKVLKTESEKVSRRGTSATVPHVYIYRDIRACNRAGW